MVFTVEEKRERKRISDKKYRESHKEVRILYNKKYYEKNTEKEKARFSLISKTPNGIKSRRISKWKGRGVICEDFDSLYCHYLNAENCQNCNVIFGEIGDGSNSWKCLDHDHETGLFRAILCNKCNCEW